MQPIARTACATLLAAVSLAALASSASAEWFINGTKLTKGSKAALASTATVDASVTFNVVQKDDEDIKISCKGPQLRSSGLEITGANEGVAKSVTFEGCETTKPATKCTLTTKRIETNELKLTATKGPGSADRGTFTSLNTEEALTAITFSSDNECVFTDTIPVYGEVTVEAATGQTEETLQAIEGLGSTENNSLEIAKNKIYAESGKTLLALASGSKWSFR